jgi:hypothetical protein
MGHWPRLTVPDPSAPALGAFPVFTSAMTKTGHNHDAACTVAAWRPLCRSAGEVYWLVSEAQSHAPKLNGSRDLLAMSSPLGRPVMLFFA